MKETLKLKPLFNDRIAFIKKEIAWLNNNIGINTKASENTRVQTSNIVSMTEIQAIDKIEKQTELLTELLKYESKNKILDDAINSLNSVERKMIFMKFEKKSDMTGIAEETTYSYRHTYNLINKGINQLAYIFYGDRALEENDLLEGAS